MTTGVRLRRLLGSADGRAVLVLLVVPLVVFVLPALLGRPAIAGDNLIQNFPLRAMTGSLIRQGHLPLWNPLIWSGNPLLGGLNAGSAYPLTFLFVFLPPVAAWVVNMLAVYWAAGLGLYALLRQFALRPTACLLAGLTYAFSGAMTGQMVHLGVIQGMAWIPLLVLAQYRLAWAVLGTGPAGVPAPAGRDRRSPWPWALLLALVIGLQILTGEPRAMAETEVVATVVALWLAAKPYAGMAVALGRRAAYLGLSVLAGAWGVVLAAAQILPGWAFITASQRAVESYSFFGAGSLRPSWTVLLLVPDVFGGDGILHQPVFFNSYNLPEVTGYVGLVPLVAAAALATRTFGRRRDRRAADWGLWLVLLVLGLLLTWGSFTPAGHAFALIPLFGKTRLQSRSLGIVDLALAVLFGFWAHRALGRASRRAGAAGWQRWVALAPVVAAGLLCVVGLAAPGVLERHLGAGGALATQLGRDLTPWFLAQLVVVVLVGALVLGWSRLDRRRRGRWLAAVVVVDLVLFTVSSSVGLLAGNVTYQPTTAQATAVLGSTGRFAIYTATDLAALSTIGQPDLNAFTGLPSVQGYGSIVSATYGAATGTHLIGTLDACALARGVFVPLRLATLLAPPAALSPVVVPGAPAPPAPPSCPGAPAPGAPGRRTFYLGQPVTVASASLVLSTAATGTPGPAGALHVGLVGPRGAVSFPPETLTAAAGGWAVQLAEPQTAYGIVVAGASAGQVAAASTVRDAAGATWTLDGVLQDALGTAGWHFTGVWRGYARFQQSHVLPPVWPQSPAPGTSVRQVRTTAWGTEVDAVRSSTGVTVVRSEAYMPGWHAQAVAPGGRTLTLAVRPHGLVQAVSLPAGSWTLTFRYRPRTLTLGLVGSAVGALGLLGGVAWLGWRRHRRQRRSAPGPDGSGASR